MSTELLCRDFYSWQMRHRKRRRLYWGHLHAPCENLALVMNFYGLFYWPLKMINCTGSHFETQGQLTQTNGIHRLPKTACNARHVWTSPLFIILIPASKVVIFVMNTSVTCTGTMARLIWSFSFVWQMTRVVTSQGQGNVQHSEFEGLRWWSVWSKGKSEDRESLSFEGA